MAGVSRGSLLSIVMGVVIIVCDLVAFDDGNELHLDLALALVLLLLRLLTLS
jgi:hypothetical protein